MDLLLDTHIFLWYIEGDTKLSVPLREIIEVSADNVYVSIVSLWEIAIKTNIGKLTLNYEFSDLGDLLESINIELLEINFGDLKIYQNLPLHHRDPFDRLIIAQAQRYDYSLVSRDANCALYDVVLIDS